MRAAPASGAAGSSREAGAGTSAQRCGRTSGRRERRGQRHPLSAGSGVPAGSLGSDAAGDQSPGGGLVRGGGDCGGLPAVQGAGGAPALTEGLEVLDR